MCGDSSTYYFCSLLKYNFSDLTIISHLQLSLSLYSSLSIVRTLPYSFDLTSFHWRTWNTTTLPSSPFGPFLSICLLGSDSRWDLRWSMLSFLGMVAIVFSAVSGPLLFPFSCFVSFCFTISIAVPRVAGDVFRPLRYSPAYRSNSAWNRGSRHLWEFTVLGFLPSTADANVDPQHGSVHRGLGDLFY